MTSSAEGIEPKRSQEYSKLLEELRNSFVSAANMAVKLYEQGKKDGLSNEEIRKDIEITLDGIVKERRLREILPAELTRSYTQAITSNSAIIAGTETNNRTKEGMTAWKEIRHQVLDRIKKTGSSSNKLQRKSKSKSKKGITPQQSIALIASIVIIIIAIGGLGIAYNVFAQNQNLTTGTTALTTEAEQIANKISVGTVDVDAVKQIMKFQPIADYIASDLSNQTIQYKGIVVIPQTVDDMINMLKQQSIDLYFDSPVTTALVDKESDAIPFLSRWKEGVDLYHSVFIVRKDSPINSSKEFPGKTIAFEAPESTSGYLLPKAYLLQKGFRLTGESAESYLGRFDDIGETSIST